MESVSQEHHRMLRTEDAATFLGIAASTLNKLRLTGAGPAYIKLGKVVVYDRSDLTTWLNTKRRLSTSVAA